MEDIKGNLNEEGVPVNMAGSGHIAGIGIGPQGEPGVYKKKKRQVNLSLLKRWTKK